MVEQAEAGPAVVGPVEAPLRALVRQEHQVLSAMVDRAMPMVCRGAVAGAFPVSRVSAATAAARVCLALVVERRARV